MRKLNLTIILLLLTMMKLFAQKIVFADSLKYEKKDLKLEEVNYLTSYYNQKGNHSAITGGVGDEALTDFVNIVEMKLQSANGLGKKKNINIDLGIDYYTSASSDKIDSRVSSASSQDVRFYPSINYNIENEITGSTKGINLSLSKEWDYLSMGGGINFGKRSKNGNTELSGKVNTFFDTYTLVTPEEFRTGSGGGRPRHENYATKSRNTYDASLALSQILTPRFQAAIIIDFAYQTGILSTPFHRTYFNDGSVKIETLPDKRYKIPIGLRANYFISNKIIVRSFLRYFQDDWGLKSYTAQLELPVRISSNISISPHFRYYTQSGIKYFGEKGSFSPETIYYSSDYDLSKFNSTFTGVGLRYTPFSSITKKTILHAVELKYGHYDRSDGLNSNIISLNLTVKRF